MSYENERDKITEGLSDELFKLLDSTGFKLVETRTHTEGEATFGSKHIVAEALVDAVDPFLRKAFEIGGGNGKAEEIEPQIEERIRRPAVKFKEGLPPPPKAPTPKDLASQRMLEEGATSFLPLKIRTAADNDLVCHIEVNQIAEVAGQAADDFIVKHLRSKGFNMNADIYREADALGNMTYRQRRR